MTRTPAFYLSASLMTLMVAAGAQAQQPPDAGRTLQELKAAPALPAASAPLNIPAPTVTKQARGGAQVTLKSVAIEGNTLLSDEELLAALGDVTGKSYDLAGLKALADKVTATYHAHDYPFARAFVPAQPMKRGVLKIEVVEGRYGAIKIKGVDERAASAQKFLDALSGGDVIVGKKLERTSLILDDQYGYSFTPVIRPGQELGTGDLTVDMARKERFGGSVSADNHGNRYTGQLRAQTSLYADSALRFGDRTTLSGIVTEEGMLYGSAGYSAPIGYSGLRGNIGYAHTYYELGKNFSALDAHGTAKVASAGLSYPIIRTQEANLSVAATYQKKLLKDIQGAAGTSEKKSSDVIPVSLNFDKRDALGGGGVTYGAVTWTHGVLDLDGALRATDAGSANAGGIFDKVNVDVARIQATPVKNLTVFARASGQLAGNNLDSSEDFGLGGPNGVRAYPSGESYGDEGFLGQVEARYQVNEKVTPYAFYDHGYVKTNQNAWTAGDNSRDIAGAGVGTRVSYKNWNADASAAWRTKGGKPQSDTRDNMPQLWVTVGYSF